MEVNDYKNYSVDSGIGSDETSDAEIICGRRQRHAVDYRKLYDVSSSTFFEIKKKVSRRELSVVELKQIHVRE